MTVPFNGYELQEMLRQRLTNAAEAVAENLFGDLVEAVAAGTWGVNIGTGNELGFRCPALCQDGDAVRITPEQFIAAFQDIADSYRSPPNTGSVTVAVEDEESARDWAAWKDALQKALALCP